jgi:mRNA-degrading endonuclease toxin of MazEF toxin-antitoxin module
MTGFVLADQIRSIDPAQRLRRIAGRASPETVAEVRARLRPIIGWTS